MSKNKDAGATDVVFEYLKTQNRPYSVTDIGSNLHNQFGKTAIQRALDQLVKDGKVREKTYGKQKVYVIEQKLFPVVDEKELKSMNLKVTELSEALKTNQEKLKSLDTKYSSLTSEMSITEIEAEIEKHLAENKRLAEKLEFLKSNKNVIEPEERDKIIENHKKYLNAWKKRKLTANEMLNAILENYPANKKVLCEEIGIECDEDVGVTFPK